MQNTIQRRVVQFAGRTAFCSNGEHGKTVITTFLVDAKCEGVQALNPMDRAVPDKLLQRSIDLERRAQALPTQDVEQVAGFHRLRRIGQYLEHQLAIAAVPSVGELGPDQCACTHPVTVYHFRLTNVIT